MKRRNATLFHVMKEDQIISSELVLYDLRNAYSFLGGTDSDYFPLRPNELLKDYIIKWAHSQNLKKFVLGGGYGEDDGIFTYKKYFSKDGVFPFYIGKRIINHEKYNILCDLRMERNKEMPNNSFSHIISQHKNYDWKSESFGGVIMLSLTDFRYFINKVI